MILFELHIVEVVHRTLETLVDVPAAESLTYRKPEDRVSVLPDIHILLDPGDLVCDVYGEPALLTVDLYLSQYRQDTDIVLVFLIREVVGV